MTQLKKRTVVLIKTETTPNFDAAPDATNNAIMVEDAEVSTVDSNMIERNPTGITLGKANGIWAGHLLQISGKIKKKGSGAATTPPEFAPVLLAAGLAETVGASNVTYATSSTLANAKHATAYVNLDGVQYIITGALTTSLSVDLEGTGTINFTMIGHAFEWGTAQAGAATSITLQAEHSATDSLYVGRTIRITHGTGAGQERTITAYTGATKVADVAAWTTTPDSTSVYRIDNGPTDATLPTPTYDSVVEPPFIAAPFRHGSYAAIISKLSFDLGLEVAKPKDVSSPDGIGTLRLVGRAVTGSFDPEAAAIADKAWEVEWRERTEATIDTNTVGDTAGNRYQVQLLRAAPNEIGHGDRDGIRTRDISFTCDGHSSDGEAVFIFS